MLGLHGGRSADLRRGDVHPAVVHHFPRRGLSLLLYFRNSANNTRLFQLVRGEDGRWQEEKLPDAFAPNQTTVVSYERASFFAEVPKIAREMATLNDVHGASLMVRLRGVHKLHSTFLKQLSANSRKVQAGGNRLILAGVEPDVIQVLLKTGLLAEIGAENIFAVQPGLGASLDAAWQEAWTWLAAEAETADT